MSFDEQPDGDIHGEDARVVDAYMKMTVHAAHCHAMLVAALEGLDLPSVDFWVCRHPAEIRALTSAVCTQAKRVNVIEQQLDTCRPYLKEGETAADALRRLEHSESFYRRRCEALQAWQSSMRDPERVIVCDILANGFTLDQPFAGDRYAGMMPASPTTKETT